jgi:hypothetical protein
MASSATNTFTKYQLTPEEQLQGDTLNIYQQYVIQNHMSDIGEQILALVFDPQNPVKFAQDDAFLKGQLTMLRLQLENSEVALAQSKSQSQE